MFTKSNTRIIFINGSVVILRQLDPSKAKCRIFIDGIEKGNLVESSGSFFPEDDISIEPAVMSRINDLAKRANPAQNAVQTS
ncbi:hypothetical protein [Pedobacter sp.]|uniref:hypothetical protein n=1 Tax=Pedobacter sp. TaxID=1411316 RepID=UPI003BABF376